MVIVVDVPSFSQNSWFKAREIGSIVEAERERRRRIESAPPKMRELLQSHPYMIITTDRAKKKVVIQLRRPKLYIPLSDTPLCSNHEHHFYFPGEYPSCFVGGEPPIEREFGVLDLRIDVPTSIPGKHYNDIYDYERTDHWEIVIRNGVLQVVIPQQ